MIYLHLGLHKTATTSLQSSIYPNLKGVKYLGRSFENIKDSDEFYIKLCTYCFSSEDDSNLELALHQELFELELKYGNVLISEEWFTADYSGFYQFSGASWQVKLRKLSKIVAGLNFSVLISIRNPLLAAYSQYCEFHSVHIQKKYSDFKAYINYSNDIKIYNYIEFDSYLSEMFGKVAYLSFDMIKDGRYRQFLSEFFSQGSLQIIKHENQRKEVAKGKVINRSNFYWDKIRLLVSKKLKAKISKSVLIVKLNDWITKVLMNKTLLKELTESDRKEFQNKYESSFYFYKEIDSSMAPLPFSE